ncbi:MAG: FAA hydrolase family protein [Desulfobacteraceae bacterium]|nr:MAG: FAA hydrolase family protein [Desulfobacteraceae bacterium]
MRLVRFGTKGEERPGLLKKENMIVDLKGLFPDMPDIGDEFFRSGWLEKVSSIDNPGQKMDVRLGCPVSRPSKIICLGKNYAEHAKEGGFDSPGKPLLFCKSPNTLNGPFDPVMLPQSCGQVDWEVELAVIIGREGKRIRREDAYEFVAGYAVMNDVSGREAQFSDSQWYRGKSFDTFAPLGPAIVTKDEIGDVQKLQLTCKVDGVIMQDGNTKDMIFDIPFIIEYISRDITLMPGDIISTGTPSGVGIFRNPPVTLNPGNIVECTIEKIGAIINVVKELK